MRANLVVALLTLGAGTALAAPSGRMTVDAHPMFVMTTSVPAGVSLMVETLNLAPGLDTVLHVQNTDANGTFVAGNDDCFSCGATLRSLVFVNSTTVAKTYSIIARSKFTSAGLGATVRLTTIGPGGSTYTDYPATIGGTIVSIPSLGANSHAMTIERQSSRLTVSFDLGSESQEPAAGIPG